MPLTHFICPDGQKIAVDDCLKKRGCRMGERCATLAYLQMCADERPYRGVTPSMSGNGPRLIYLRATTDYAISPDDRAFVTHGTGVHGKLSLHKYNVNVLAEEKIEAEFTGTPDCLEEDENNPGKFILYDYKTFGSYKVSKCLGIVKKDVETGEVYVSGSKKGQKKTRKEFEIDPNAIDIYNEALQLNLYRIGFTRCGFDVSQLRIMAIVRDGNTFSAKNNGIFKCTYVINVPMLPADEVLSYYRTLQAEIDEAFKTGTCRACNSNENWNGRRCDGYCEVSEECKKMSERRTI